MATTALAPAERSPSVAVLAILALGYLALWPAVSALFALAVPDASAILIYPTVAFGSLLFLVAGLAAGAGHLRGLFRPWQLACGAVFGAVFLHGLADPSHARGAAVALGALHAFLLAGAVGAALLFRAGGAAMMRAFLLCFVASVTLYAAVFLIFQQQFVAAAPVGWIYAFPPFVNVRKFTSLLAVAALVVLALWAMTGRRSPDATAAGPSARAAVALSLWVLLATFLFWTGGRAPVVALIIGIAAGVILCERTARRRLLVAAVAGLVLAGALSSLLPRPSLAAGLVQRLTETAQAPTVELATTHRAGIWQQTAELIAQRPWLGHGYNQWMLQNPEFRLHGSTHNLPLQVVHDFGILGGGALLLLVFGTWAGHLRGASNRHPLHLVALMALTSLLAQSFVDAIFLTTASLQLVLMVFALAHATRGLPWPEAPATTHRATQDERGINLL